MNMIEEILKTVWNALLEAVSPTPYEKLLHQLSLTDNEALSVGNSYSVIPQNLMYKEGTNPTRKEIIQELLSNDPHSKNQQDWTLELMKRKEAHINDAGLVEEFKMRALRPL